MKNFFRSSFTLLAPTLLLALAPLTACDEDDDNGDGAAEGTGGDGGNEEVEVISIVRLNFNDGTDTTTFTFEDPDGDGAMEGTAEAITLTAGATYTLTVEFINGLETPNEDITAEVAEEDDEHQVFIYGDAVEGPATTNTGVALTHAYGDTDGGGLPVGLTNTITANAAGTGTFSILLRHLPPVNGEAVKVDGLAADFAAGTALPGDTDVDVSFAVTVQ